MEAPASRRKKCGILIGNVREKDRGKCLDNWIGREYLSCKCFALKRTSSKCFAGRVVKCFALLSLPGLWDRNALLLLLGLIKYST